MTRFCRLIILVAAVTFSGCDCRAPTPPTETPAEKFDKMHGGKTITPNGVVVPGSARDTNDGRVEYKTDGGKTWTVQPQPEGGYGTPVPAQ